ncbi:MAG: peptidylprolyl isomerase [Acidobacteria bacterium]|nr:peptidylprolyl isomerase [Acidobacteriota bacterium]
MLVFMRRRKRLKLVLWLVIIALAASMVLFFVNVPGPGDLGITTVAMVDGNPISIKEFRQAYFNLHDLYRRSYNVDPSVLKAFQLDKMALEQLLQQQVMVLEAYRMGITATPQEVAQRVTSLPEFQEQGKFIGVNRYQELLLSYNSSPAEFEEDIRRAIILEKFRRVLTDSVAISDRELREEFRNQNEKVSIEYVTLPITSFYSQVQVSEAEIGQHYEKNKESYKLPEQRKAQYLYFSPSRYRDQVQVSEQEMRDYDARNPEPERVRASHILFKVEDPPKEAEVRKKAESVLEQVRKGGDFAELAKKHSEDTSASQGGDLGFFTRGQMVKEFEDKAFSLQPGQTSDLVRSTYGFHIIRVTERVSPTYESRKPVIQSILVNEKSNQISRQRAEQAREDLRKNADWNGIAARYQAEIRETPLFGKGDVVPLIGQNKGFENEMFTLAKGGLGSAYETPVGWVIARLTEIHAPGIPPLSEVRTRVEGEVRKQKADALAQERANQVAGELKSADAAAVATKRGLSAQTSGEFTRLETLPKLAESSQIVARAFNLKAAEVGGPVRAGDEYVAFKVKSRTEPDWAKFDQQRESLQSQLAAKKQNRLLESYLKGLMDKLRKENKIVVNSEAIGTIVASS